jgi:glutamine synthetase
MSDKPLNLPDTGKVKFFRIVWCDNGGVIRGKAVHRDRFDSYIKHGVGISEAQQGVPVMIDAPAVGSGLGPVGEVRLTPDLSTLTVLPYAPDHARVMGSMMQNGKPWPLCPRHFLKRMIAAVSGLGMEVMAAFENEFYLLRPSEDGIIPADETAFASTLSMDMNHAVIDAISDALIAQGLVIEQYYPESGPGQHEISILYRDALSAADQQIIFRETVKAVAGRHQLKATFLPKVFQNQAGSGSHLHLSLWRDGVNMTPSGSGGLSDVARQFMAGILDHLPALMALTTPSTNSYRRIRPHCWSGAFRCWGMDNREAAIRVPSFPEPPSPTHFELKTMDATANPYLALGAVIAAGLDGMRRGLNLNEPVAVDPGALSASERAARGIDPLPTRLGEAIEHLRKDEALLDALGPELSKAYIAVREAEWSAMQDWAPEQEVKLLLERY